MSHTNTLTIPSASEIAKRIKVCRAELANLRRLHRLACAAEKACAFRATNPDSRREEGKQCQR